MEKVSERKKKKKGKLSNSENEPIEKIKDAKSWKISRI